MELVDRVCGAREMAVSEKVGVNQRRMLTSLRPVLDVMKAGLQRKSIDGMCVSVYHSTLLRSRQKSRKAITREEH